VIVLTLALGVGGNVAALSLLEQILLRPLDVHEPDRLVNVTAPGRSTASRRRRRPERPIPLFSYPMFRDLEREQDAFSGLAAHRLFDASIAASDGVVRRRTGMLVSGSYFPVLRGLLFGVAPVDVSALVVATGALVLVALTAAYLPLRRALAVEPSVVRRDE